MMLAKIDFLLLSYWHACFLTICLNLSHLYMKVYTKLDSMNLFTTLF